MITTELYLPATTLDGETSALIARLRAHPKIPCRSVEVEAAYTSTNDLVLMSLIPHLRHLYVPHLPERSLQRLSSDDIHKPVSDKRVEAIRTRCLAHILALHESRGLAWSPILDLAVENNLCTFDRTGFNSAEATQWLQTQGEAAIIDMLTVFSTPQVLETIARAAPHPSPALFPALLRNPETLEPFFNNPALDNTIAQEFANAIITYLLDTHSPKVLSDRDYRHYRNSSSYNISIADYIGPLARVLRARTPDWPTLRGRLEGYVGVEPNPGNRYYKSPQVSILVASDKHSSQKTLRVLSHLAEDEEVRWVLLANPSLPIDAREAIYKAAESTQNGAAIAEYNLPPDIQRELLAHLKPLALSQLLTSPRCPLLYAQLAVELEQLDGSIRESMAQNPVHRADPVILARLMLARTGGILKYVIPEVDGPTAVHLWTKWLRTEPDEAIEYLTTIGLPGGVKPPRNSVISVMTKTVKGESDEKVRLRRMKVTALLANYFVSSPQKGRGRPRLP